MPLMHLLLSTEENHPSQHFPFPFTPERKVGFQAIMESMFNIKSCFKYQIVTILESGFWDLLTTCCPGVPGINAGDGGPKVSPCHWSPRKPFREAQRPG